MCKKLCIILLFVCFAASMLVDLDAPRVTRNAHDIITICDMEPEIFLC